MAESAIFHDYHVVKVEHGERPFHVYWRESEMIDGKPHWRDGAFISAHRREELAHTKASALNMIIPAPYRLTNDGRS